jgi:hypothetical protein
VLAEFFVLVGHVSVPVLDTGASGPRYRFVKLTAPHLQT